MLKWTLAFLAVFAAASFLSSPKGHASDDIEALLRYMPASSNVVAVVRVQEILESPRAKRENWKNEDTYFLAGSEHIPTWPSAIVVATQYQPGDAGGWTASALMCPDGVSVQAMARDERRELQELGGVDAMHTARDAYLLQLSPNVLGVLSPALRQESARWVKSVTRSSTPQLSSYLLESGRSTSDIVMAVDMRDMLDPRLIRRRLGILKMFEGRNAAVEQLVKLFQDLQGVALHIEIEDATNARVELKFGQELPDQAQALKSVLLEMLADESVVLNSFRDGTARIDGNVFSMTTELSDEELRRVMTLVLSPYPTSPTDSGAIVDDSESRPTAQSDNEPTQSENEADEAMRRNRKYYNAVRRSLEDADRMTSSALDYKQSATYLDRYASKIERLSREGVDPVLLDFAAQCSSQLRTLAASTRVLVTDVNTQEGTITTRVTSAGVTPVATGWRRGGWWGRGSVRYGYAPHWNVDSNLKDVRERQAASITSFSSSAEQIRLELGDLNSQVKRQMEEKYGPDFSKYRF